MSRLGLINDDNVNEEQRELLTAVQQGLGKVPNFIRVLAQSPAALRAFLGLHGIAGAGALDVQHQERIAIALAQLNRCEYCLSAHSFLGRKAGLSDEEIQLNRAINSFDRKGTAVVRLARSLVEDVGDVSTFQLTEAENAGLSRTEIVEVIVHVALNLMTNILARASKVEIDFPRVGLG